MEYNTVNLEQGMPTVDQALRMLNQSIRTSRSYGCKALKVIHGYGSSGRGGAIRSGVHRTLTEKQKAGEIAGFVRGEDFSPFDENARKLLDRCPSLSRDRDYLRANHGITVILLK